LIVNHRLDIRDWMMAGTGIARNYELLAVAPDCPLLRAGAVFLLRC
jgi:hypothetical protein